MKAVFLKPYLSECSTIIQSRFEPILVNSQHRKSILPTLFRLELGALELLQDFQYLIDLSIYLYPSGERDSKMYLYNRRNVTDIDEKYLIS